MQKTANELFKIFRADVKQKLGMEIIKRLHQQRPWIDWLVFFSLIALLFALMAALYTLHFGIAWMACLIAQAYVMQGIGFFGHDAFTHRYLGGKKLGYCCNLFCTIPYFRLSTKYYATHVHHHRYLNTVKDPRAAPFFYAGKQNAWSKILWFTPLGAIKFMAEFLGVKARVSEKYRAQIKKERMMLFIFVVIMLLLTALFPYFFIYGYWLPLMVVLPPITMLQLLLFEHGEINPDNPIQAVTNYRSGIIFKILHGFDSGDCHLVHHIYPNIPFYNISKAIAVLRPHLRRYGVYEHHSLLSILYQFFIKNKKLYTFWRINEPSDSAR